MVQNEVSIAEINSRIPIFGEWIVQQRDYDSLGAARKVNKYYRMSLQTTMSVKCRQQIAH